MKEAPYNLLLQTASGHNILTLTTACSTSCVFCSHHQNPPNIDAYYVKDLSLDMAYGLVDFLDKNKKIVIGESATRICEGEPFSYPYLFEVLRRIRKKYPKTPIQITTSGVPLTEAMLDAMSLLGGIELNISLNSSTPEGRKKLFNGQVHLEAVHAVRSLAAHPISFSGSIVAMPHLVGYEDIEETIKFLSAAKASTIRVFMPGYTRFGKSVLNDKSQVSDDEIFMRLSHLIEALQKETGVPILLEPAPLLDLKAEVQGVILDSPAARSDLRIGDIILKVNNKPVFSRVDAYYQLLSHENPLVEISRQDALLIITMIKARNTASGLVFHYDMHPDTVLEIEKAIKRNKNKKILLMTSQLAYPVMIHCVVQNDWIKIAKVDNLFFGGNIKCAGLLTVSDLAAHLDSLADLPEVILLPAVIFDGAGNDLTGVHYMHLKTLYDIKIEVI